MITLIKKTLAILFKKEHVNCCGLYADDKEEVKALWKYTNKKMKESCISIPSNSSAIWCQENNIWLGSYSANIMTYIKLLEDDFEALSIESSKLIEQYEELEKQIKQQD